MERKKRSNVILIGMIVAIIAIIAISFALLQTTIYGQKNVILRVGDIDVTIADDSINVISVSNGLPAPDEVGKATSPYKFTINNNGTRKVKVDIYLDDDAEQLATCQSTNGSCPLIDDTMIKFELITSDGTTSGVLPANRYIGEIATIAGGSSSNCELRIWLSYDADNTAKNKYFFGKIKLDVTELTE